MKIDIYTNIALLIVNLIIIGYEKGLNNLTWKHYTAFGVLFLISAVFPVIIFVLLIPITAYNVFNNTKKLRGL